MDYIWEVPDNWLQSRLQHHHLEVMWIQFVGRSDSPNEIVHLCIPDSNILWLQGRSDQNVHLPFNFSI